MNIFKTIKEWETVDGITDRNVVLGNPKYGKSTYGRLKLEIYCDKKWPVTVIDPAGIMHSIRAVRDDVVIVGGEHGDVELDQVDKVLPNLMRDNVNFIIDTSELDDEFNKEVVGDLFEVFFLWHKANRQVRKYIIDECDYYIPQYHFDRVCKMNITRCVSKGRMFGMGFDFITQNFTMIDKTILKMVENHLIFNMSDEIDLKRIGGLLGERLDSKIKHLGIGRCLIYNKVDRNTYTVDKPKSPSVSSTPKFGQQFSPITLKELNPVLQEIMK